MKQENPVYSSTHERLLGEGFSPEQPLKLRSKISTTEKGKRYTLLTKGTEKSAVYAVDGNIVKEGQRCDKLVLVKRSDSDGNPGRWTEAFIELKGVDVVHAISQLRETLRKSIFKHPSNDDVRARIVGQSFPSSKSNPVMEKAKQEFRKKYNCDLRSMKSGQDDKL